MMQGITSLPGAQQGPQGPMPGQSAPAQVMPQQQGGIAPPITAPLEKLPPQQLLMMYNNPQDMTPKWAVATAYAKAIEQARLMQMAQGQSAMAQGMAQAQEPPVVQQIMSQPMPRVSQEKQIRQEIETAFAKGDLARASRLMEVLKQFEQAQFTQQGEEGYAGGGAVSFDAGGLTLGSAPDYQAARRFGIDLSPYDSPEVREEKLKRTRELLGLEQAYQDPSRQKDIPPIDYGTKATEDRGYRPSPPQPGKPAAIPMGGDSPPGISALLNNLLNVGTNDDIEKSLGEQVEAARRRLQGARTVPENLLRARSAVDEQMRGGLAGIDAERKRRQEAIEKMAAQNEARFNKSIQQDPAMWQAAMRGVNASTGRVGSILSNVAEQLGGAMQGKEERKQRAEEALEARRDAMFELDKYRQDKTMLMAQRTEAIAKEDWNRVEAIDAKIEELGINHQKALVDIRDKAQNRRTEAAKVFAEVDKNRAIREQTAASREQAAASREAALDERYSRQYNDVVRRLTELGERIKEGHKKKYSRIYLLTNPATNPDPTPAQLKELQAADAELAKELNKMRQQYAPQLNSLRDRLGFAGSMNWEDIPG